MYGVWKAAILGWGQGAQEGIFLGTVTVVSDIAGLLVPAFLMTLAFFRVTVGDG